MSLDVEYAIKKDIRNNPVIRDLDSRQRREFRRIVWLAGLAVCTLLFSAWQHFKTLQYGYDIEQLGLDRAAEETINRQLRLNLETQLAPQRIEQRARRELGLQTPASNETLVIERAPSSSPSSDIVARAR
jgi:cell division protein FtsL